MTAFILQGCHTSVSTNTAKSNFDIPTYIKNESSRLQKQNPLVTKTVVKDKSQESKQLKIDNWTDELAQFTTLDLNKSATEDFVQENSKDTLIYKSNSSSSNTLIVKIVPSNNTLSYLSVKKHTKNLLFENTESLIYIPNSYYSIEKKQFVRGLGENNYSITGKF